jgi:hypothetical protein
MNDATVLSPQPTPRHRAKGSLESNLDSPTRAAGWLPLEPTNYFLFILFIYWEGVELLLGSLIGQLHQHCMIYDDEDDCGIIEGINDWAEKNNVF